MQFLASPILRIAIGAAAAVYLSPAILNKVLIAELNPADEARNVRVTVATTTIITTAVYVALGLAAGTRPAGVPS